MATTKSSENETKIMNRGIIVVGAIMIQVALGAIYAWSAFTTPLQGTETAISQFAFSKTETQAIFSAGLATFAIFTIIGGRLQKKYGPRKIALIGGILLGLGYLLGSFVGANFPLKLLSIGIIAGAGIGFGYVVPIAVGVKWYPDKWPCCCRIRLWSLHLDPVGQPPEYFWF
jgi:OFA family oxalate/formate antiporter-like MFS transporter